MANNVFDEKVVGVELNEDGIKVKKEPKIITMVKDNKKELCLIAGGIAIGVLATKFGPAILPH